VFRESFKNFMHAQKKKHGAEDVRAVPFPKNFAAMKNS
jgi:hypothetical protein